MNGFTRLDEGDRWKEQNLLARYRDLLPEQDLDDERVVLEASPYYLSGMVDSFEDLTRFTRYIPGFKCAAGVERGGGGARALSVQRASVPVAGDSRSCLGARGWWA